MSGFISDIAKPTLLTQSGGSPPSIDALRKDHSPWMLSVLDQAGFFEWDIWNIWGRRGSLGLDVARL
jgi:hypothetical protein